MRVSTARVAPLGPGGGEEAGAKALDLFGNLESSAASCGTHMGLGGSSAHRCTPRLPMKQEQPWDSGHPAVRDTMTSHSSLLRFNHDVPVL